MVIYVFAYLSVHLSICLSIYVSSHLPVCLSVFPVAFLFISLLSIFLSFVYLSTLFSTHLFPYFPSICSFVEWLSSLSICSNPAVSVHLSMHDLDSTWLSIHRLSSLQLHRFKWQCCKKTCSATQISKRHRSAQCNKDPQHRNSRTHSARQTKTRQSLAHVNPQSASCSDKNKTTFGLPKTAHLCRHCRTGKLPIHLAVVVVVALVAVFVA